MHENLKASPRDDRGARRRSAMEVFRKRLMGAALIGLGLVAYWFGRAVGVW